MRFALLILLLTASGCRASWPADKCSLGGSPRVWACTCKVLHLDRQAVSGGHRITAACDDVALPITIDEAR